MAQRHVLEAIGAWEAACQNGDRADLLAAGNVLAQIASKYTERGRRKQREVLKRGQAETLGRAVNRRRPWTRTEDDRILAFMEAPNARINDLAVELGRSRAGITNRLRKLRQQRGEAAPESCRVDGCERPRLARGLCMMHYNRHRRGHPAAESAAPLRVSKKVNDYV